MEKIKTKLIITYLLIFTLSTFLLIPFASSSQSSTDNLLFPNENLKIKDPFSNIVYNNLNTFEDTSQFNLLSTPSKESNSPSLGYIVEFKKEPLIIKRQEYKITAEKNSKSTLNQIPLIKYVYRAFVLMPNEVATKSINYRDEILSENLEIIDEVLDANVKTEGITGNILANSGESPSDSKVILGQYVNVINAVAVNLPENAIENLKNNPQVKSIQKNKPTEIFLTNSIPFIQNKIQSGNLDENGDDCTISKKTCLTGKNVKIAIIDTGVDYTHSDLGGCFGKGCKVVDGYDFTDEDPDPMDEHGHGTHVAGIAAGNGILKGVAPEALIYAYKVLNKDGRGYENWVIAGIDRAIDPNNDADFSDKVDVISISLGSKEGNPDSATSKAVDKAVNFGVVVVVAAGNSGGELLTIGSPASSRKAITVAASDNHGDIASFSSKGPIIWIDDSGVENSILKPDIAAPGVDICAAQQGESFLNMGVKQCIDEDHILLSGTSMATPHVSGIVALLKQKNPNLTPDEIKRLLKGTAKPLYYIFNYEGAGLINPNKALSSSKIPDLPFDFFIYVDPIIRNIHDPIIIKGVFPKDYDQLNVTYQIYNPARGISIRQNLNYTLINTGSNLLSFSPNEITNTDSSLYITLKITKGGITKAQDLYLKIDATLKSGWPKYLYGSGYGLSLTMFPQPTIADIDGDGSKDMVYTYSYDGIITPNLQVLNSKGESLLSLNFEDYTTQVSAVFSDFTSKKEGKELLFSIITPQWERDWVIHNPKTNETSVFESKSGNLVDFITHDFNNDKYNELVYIDGFNRLQYFDLHNYWDNKSNSLTPTQLEGDSQSKLIHWTYNFRNDSLCKSKSYNNGEEVCGDGISIVLPYYLNLDEDTQNEILVVVQSTRINETHFYAFNDDGSKVQGYPKIYNYSIGCKFQGQFDSNIFSQSEMEVFCLKRISTSPLILSKFSIGEKFNIKESEPLNFNEIISKKFEIYSVAVGVFNNKTLLVMPVRDLTQLYGDSSSLFLSYDTFKKVAHTHSSILTYNSGFYAIGNFGDGNSFWAGSDGKFSSFTKPNNTQFIINNKGLIHNEIISDVDNDGFLELISYDISGFVYVRDMGGAFDNGWGEYFYDAEHSNCFNCKKELPAIPTTYQINVSHNISNNTLTITYTGKLPYKLNLRNDANIGTSGGYVWGEFYSPTAVISLKDFINPTGIYYYGVFDGKNWSETKNFCLSQSSQNLKTASILKIPLEENVKCYSGNYQNSQECKSFYKQICNSNNECWNEMACPKFYNPVYDSSGAFYPSACWAENFGVYNYSYGYSPQLTQFIKDMWATKKLGQNSYEVPSPDLEFSYSGSGILGWKSGTFFRSSIVLTNQSYMVLDYDIDTNTFLEKKVFNWEESLVSPAHNTQIKTLLIFVTFDNAYPESILLDWTKTYEPLMNDYVRKKQLVSSPIQYKITPVVISPPDGVKNISALHDLSFTEEEIQKIYTAAINKSINASYNTLIISPLFLNGYGGYYSTWQDKQLIVAPLIPNQPYSTIDKKEGILGLIAFQELFGTISHEVLHAVGLQGDHVPMGYGTYFLSFVGKNINSTTGKLNTNEISTCDFLGKSPDYYTIEVPQNLQMTVGEEPLGALKENSESGSCVSINSGQDWLKDYDHDGVYEMVYSNNLIGKELQRFLGWVDIDGDEIAELMDPKPYGGLKKINEKIEYSCSGKFSMPPMEIFTINNCTFAKVKSDDYYIRNVPLKCAAFNDEIINLYEGIQYCGHEVMNTSYGDIMFARIP